MVASAFIMVSSPASVRLTLDFDLFASGTLFTCDGASAECCSFTSNVSAPTTDFGLGGMGGTSICSGVDTRGSLWRDWVVQSTADGVDGASSPMMASVGTITVTCGTTTGTQRGGSTQVNQVVLPRLGEGKEVISKTVVST